MSFDREAFHEACRRYLHIEGESVDRAFVFYSVATAKFEKPTPETIEWAQRLLAANGDEKHG